MATGGSEQQSSGSGGKPKRLRPWLESLLDRKHVPGLFWIDRSQMMFQIPWKHRGKQDWEPENSRIFKVRRMMQLFLTLFNSGVIHKRS